MSQVFSKIHLITQIPQHSSRMQEYLYCLENNLKLADIHKVHLITARQLNIMNGEQKLEVHSGIEDMTITFGLRIALNFTQTGDIVIIANADIYFDHTVRSLKHIQTFPWFLSRYEHYPLKGPLYIGNQCSAENYIGSHDTFVFRMSVPNEWYALLDWSLGTPGMEARMIWELAQYGVEVQNPCSLVKSWHVHYSRRPAQYRFPVVNTTNRSLLAWPI